MISCMTFAVGEKPVHQSPVKLTLSPPPYRPAPAAVRTQPDGQTQQEQRSALSRSDSYRLANDEAGLSPVQRNRSDSYRRANGLVVMAAKERLGPLRHVASGSAVATGTGQFISGHLGNGSSVARCAAQPMSYTVKSPMLVKQMSSPAFAAGHVNDEFFLIIFDFYRYFSEVRLGWVRIKLH